MSAALQSSGDQPSTLGHEVSVAGGQRRHRRRVDMRDEPRRGIEGEVVALVLPGKCARGQLGQGIVRHVGHILSAWS
jgi:hypothetical protein